MLIGVLSSASPIGGVRVLHQLMEDKGRMAGLIIEYVRVDPEGDCGVRMA